MKGSRSIICITFSFFFFFFFIFEDVFATPITKHLCSPEQRDALLEFKNEFTTVDCNYNGRPKTDSWNNNTDCCNWLGIKCNAKSGEVIELDLSSSCIDGQFRSDNSFFWLQNFHFLTTLKISFNSLTGPIPSSIGNLSSLTTLDLSENQLSGEIPFTIGKLSRLTTLDLSCNKLLGPIPSSIENLSRLTFLDLSSNHCSGPILYSIGKLFRLINLDLSFNQFTGQIPSSIGNLSHLSHLIISNNKVEGQVPLWLWTLPKLEYLKLSDNSFISFEKSSKPGHSSIRTSSKIKSLDVSHNQLVGKLPRSLLHFSSLEVLNVESNKINDTFPLWLSSLKKLKVLVLGSNVFHGPLHQVSFPELRFIDISHNHFNGTLSSDYFSKWIALSSNEDPGIFSEINFSGNKLDGQIPRSIGILKQVRALDLSNNAFVGHIPSSMGNLTALERLDLSQNLLSGEIPHELRDLAYLSYVSISHNQISGLPPKCCQFVTQSCSSFEDNMRYFLWKTCKNIEPVFKNPVELSNEEDVINWKAGAIGYGLGIVFGFTVGNILFSLYFSFSFKK